MKGDHPWIGIVGKAAVALLLVNELRGAVLAVPVMWAMYQAGGTMMALWLGFCSLAGIALSVVAPLFAARFVGRKWAARSMAETASA